MHSFNSNCTAATIVSTKQRVNVSTANGNVPHLPFAALCRALHQSTTMYAKLAIQSSKRGHFSVARIHYRFGSAPAPLMPVPPVSTSVIWSIRQILYVHALRHLSLRLTLVLSLLLILLLSILAPTVDLRKGKARMVVIYQCTYKLKV